MDLKTKKLASQTTHYFIHTRFPKRSAQTEDRDRKNLLAPHNCVLFLHFSLPGSSLTFWTCARNHAQTHTTLTPLCQVAESQDVIKSTRQGACISWWVSWALSDTCHRKWQMYCNKHLCWDVLCWVTSCNKCENTDSTLSFFKIWPGLQIKLSCDLALRINYNTHTTINKLLEHFGTWF